MKKLLSILVCAMCVFCLSSCGGKSGDAKTGYTEEDIFSELIEHGGKVSKYNFRLCPLRGTADEPLLDTHIPLKGLGFVNTDADASTGRFVYVYKRQNGKYLLYLYTGDEGGAVANREAILFFEENPEYK